MKNRKAWGLAGVLSAGVLFGLGKGAAWLRPYWVAKYRGRGADLHGAVLALAPLQGSDLTDANLQNADLRGARYDRHTRWPSGFDPRPHGAILMQ